MKQELILHLEENEWRGRVFTACLLLAFLELLILSPVSGELRIVLALVSIVLVPIGFAMLWLVLIVQFYNPFCPKKLLKYACLYFFYACLFSVVLGCLSAPFVRYFSPHPIKAVAMALSTSGNIGGCLGSLYILRRVNHNLTQKQQIGEAQQPHSEATSKTAPFQGTVSESSDA